MGWLGAGAIGAVVTALAVMVVVHAGRTPGGVDTWYYLAYARAVRRRRSLDVRLPQYLLQDEVQSYPPVFPSVLALLPERWLDRWYWVLSPLVDCVHLLALYVVTFRLTGSVAVAGIAAATYAFTPHLISETRSLSGRTFGALLHTVAILLLLKWALSATNEPTWAVAAALAGALLFLSSAAMAAAYGFVCVSLSLVFADVRYGLLAWHRHRRFSSCSLAACYFKEFRADSHSHIVGADQKVANSCVIPTLDHCSEVKPVLARIGPAAGAAIYRASVCAASGAFALT